jgi:hypothetical protein
MTTWRDIADQLTAGQAAELADAEVEVTDAALLRMARTLAAQNLTEMMFADVCDPPGAATVSAWRQGVDGAWSRCFDTGDVLRSGPARVFYTGRQFSDGTVQRQVILMCDDASPLTPEQCRELAAMLLTVADSQR